MRGPGKYDEAATAAREATGAAGVILIVVGGKLGSGFSVQCYDKLLPPAVLAQMLESVAAEIRSGAAEAP
jgi:predicted ATPase with chaperone activity